MPYLSLVVMDEVDEELSNVHMNGINYLDINTRSHNLEKIRRGIVLFNFASGEVFPSLMKHAHP